MLVLASKSAARKALLNGAGLRFETCPVEIDERALEASMLGKGAGATEVARELAVAKARAASRRRPGDVVIGGDQVLAHDGELLHKPENRIAARDQLLRLRGGQHFLHAGIALVQDSELLWSSVESAGLTMRRFDEAELLQAMDLEGDEILHSVGAYRLEGPSIRLFERIEGDYFTILGLPLLPLLEALRTFAPQTLSS